MVADGSGAEQLIRGFLSDGYPLFATVEHDNGRLATVRLNRPSGGLDVTVDLLFASSGIEPEIAQSAEVMEIVPEPILPVATTGHLVALKVLAATTCRGHRTSRICVRCLKWPRTTTWRRHAVRRS